MCIDFKAMRVCVVIGTLAVSAGPTCLAGVVATLEAPGAQSSNVPGAITETFDEFSQGSYSTLVTAVGKLSAAGAFNLSAAGIYGGAGGVGNYFVIGADPVTLTFNAPQSYFGMWWAAGDVNNTLQIFSGSSLLATYTDSSLLGSLPASYYGNPNNGGDSGEPFAYINFTGTGGTTFTSIVFSNNNRNSTGFDADNLSVASVPEPSSLTLGGTALAVSAIAFAWRRRRTNLLQWK